MSAAGRMKQTPATSRPGQPCRAMADVDGQLGRVRPGNEVRRAEVVEELLARQPRRRRTTSSSISAMCAAGPPKAVVPRRRKSCRRVEERAESPSVGLVRIQLRLNRIAAGNKRRLCSGLFSGNAFASDERRALVHALHAGSGGRAAGALHRPATAQPGRRRSS